MGSVFSKRLDQDPEKYLDLDPDSGNTDPKHFFVHVTWPTLLKVSTFWNKFCHNKSWSGSGKDLYSARNWIRIRIQRIPNGSETLLRMKSKSVTWPTLLKVSSSSSRPGSQKKVKSCGVRLVAASIKGTFSRHQSPNSLNHCITAWYDHKIYKQRRTVLTFDPAR